MAGYSKIYCIGEEGGFLGSDGVNPIGFQIFVGEANRQWLEVRYFEKGIKPLAGITRIIPKGPDDPDALLDACIAFYPEHFYTCPSMPVVLAELKPTELLDFHVGNIPQSWPKLRSEARSLFAKLHIWKAILQQLQ